jgi:hypothetical protein
VSRNRQLPYLEIKSIGKDEIGYFLKIEVQLFDGEITIRWGIDQVTFRKIRSITESQYFDKLPGLKYHFSLLTEVTYQIMDREEKEQKYLGKIEIIYENKRKNIQFECSKLFASNLEWFKTIKSQEEVKHLEWKETN